VLLDVFDQAILILAHLEKIVVFTELLDGPFAVGTEAVVDIFFRPKPLVICAIPSSVIIFINQLLVVKILKISLNGKLVRRICRSDKGIMRNVEPFPKLLELGCQLVAMDLRINACFGRSLLDLLSMFIEPGEKKNIATSQAPVASKHIGGDRGIGVSDMRHVVHVIDRGCDVKGHSSVNSETRDSHPQITQITEKK
jgi:hypothetical protein